MGREIGELGTRSRIRVRADHDSHRGRLQVKKRMDGILSRNDRNSAPCFQLRNMHQLQVTQTEMGCDRSRLLEVIGRVDARAGHDMECTRELVLVDVRRPVEPEESLNIELRVVVED